MASSKKVPALLLSLGGAPASWHVIEGLGYVHPEIPSPVGGEGEVSLEAAKKAAADAGCHVYLEEVTATQAEKSREARAQARGEGIRGARELRKLGQRARKPDAEKVQDEVAAAAGKDA